MVNPDEIAGLLDGLSGPVAKRLSSKDLSLVSRPTVVQRRVSADALAPPLEPESTCVHVVTLVPTDEQLLQRCGYLCIGVDEGPSESSWSFFWGFVGPVEDPFLSQFRTLGEKKRLREEVWEIGADMPARSMLRWFGIPIQGPDHYVEIKSFGTLGAQLGSWVRDFLPSAVMMDLPNWALMPGAQRSLPQLIGADLERLLPLLRISLGLPARDTSQRESPYPSEMADSRRRPPLLFLSYSRKDDFPEGNGIVTQLYRAIHNRQPGITFFDSSDLKAGDEWRDLIEKKISETSVLVVLVSGNSLQSGEVELEFRQFVAKLADEDWPGIVVPIPIDADSFEFFRAGASAGSTSWWNKSVPVSKGDASEVGLASFNFERESLTDLGPDRMAEKLLGVYGQYREEAQQRLSG